MTASATKLLSAIQASGGQVRLHGKNLLVEAATPLPDDLIEGLRCHKPEIIRFLSMPKVPVASTLDYDVFDECAAIIEANGIPHEWAHGFATLCTMPRPTAFLSTRWQQLIDDGGLFLDQWGRKAAGLGWRAVDIFGVNPNAPEYRCDCQGLVLLLAGRRVIAITADTARIDCGGGAHLTFYRKTMAAGAVAFWKLEGR